MSGPLQVEDAGPAGDAGADAPATAAPPCVEVTASRTTSVGRLPVRRALPRRARRTVGAWCFVDHMGPTDVTEEAGVDIAPHPHMGLQTVTWLLAGEVLHRDSLGSEQVVRPGQLNLMSAGRGVAHSEERTGAYRGELHGVQLWVAQPEATRHGEGAFEHHAELPRLDVGRAVATVLVGALDRTASPSRRDSDHVGVDLALRPGVTVLPLEPAYEHALVVLDGAVAVAGAGETVRPGTLAYLGLGRDELALDALEPARALLLGGTPFPDPLVMWWNFVGRSREEITRAWHDWEADDGRFGAVASALLRMSAAPPAWLSGKDRGG